VDLGQIHLHELNEYYYFLVLLCLWYFDLVKESGKYDAHFRNFDHLDLGKFLLLVTLQYWDSFG
jgi:hypothetical protein